MGLDGRFGELEFDRDVFVLKSAPDQFQHPKLLRRQFGEPRAQGLGEICAALLVPDHEIARNGNRATQHPLDRARQFALRCRFRQITGSTQRQRFANDLLVLIARDDRDGEPRMGLSQAQKA